MADPHILTLEKSRELAPQAIFRQFLGYGKSTSQSFSASFVKGSAGVPENTAGPMLLRAKNRPKESSVLGIQSERQPFPMDANELEKGNFPGLNGFPGNEAFAVLERSTAAFELE